MRALTFKGFLARYTRELSGLASNDLKRLAGKAAANYRLVEPLVLYAAATDKLGYLRRVAWDPYLVMEAREFPGDMDWSDVIAVLDRGDESVLRSEYHKAYRSYISVRDRQKTKNRSKALALNKTLDIQRQKKVSTYRIYHDLELNHGNVNAYLKNRDVSKVSLEVAEKVLDYLERL